MVSRASFWRAWKLEKSDTHDKSDLPPWFRGEPFEYEQPLLPKIYRITNGIEKETELLLDFRIKARAYESVNLPPRNHTDEWLFLAQHVGLPTRLLDWTESLLTALFFALEKTKYKNDKTKQCEKTKRLLIDEILLDEEDNIEGIDPIIWMLNPGELNTLSTGKMVSEPGLLTWFDPENQNPTRNQIREVNNRIGDTLNSILDHEPIRQRMVREVLAKPNLANINIRAA